MMDKYIRSIYDNVLKYKIRFKRIDNTIYTYPFPSYCPVVEQTNIRRWFLSDYCDWLERYVI